MVHLGKAATSATLNIYTGPAAPSAQYRERREVKRLRSRWASFPDVCSTLLRCPPTVQSLYDPPALAQWLALDYRYSPYLVYIGSRDYPLVDAGACIPFIQMHAAISSSQGKSHMRIQCKLTFLCASRGSLIIVPQPNRPPPRHQE